MKKAVRIVIIGGSWGGLATAWYLRERLPKNYEIQLISDQPKTIIRASFPRVIFEDLPLKELEFDLSEHLKNSGIMFNEATLQSVDEKADEIVTDKGRSRYNILVIATGASPDYNGLPGAKEYGHSICDFGKILETKEAILNFRHGNFYSSLGPNTPCDGPTMEILLGLDHRLRELGVRDRAKLHFTTGKKHLMPPGGPKVWDYLKKYFQSRDIETKTDLAAVKIDRAQIYFEDGSKRPYDMFVYVAPYQGIKVFQDHPLSDERGFIKVNFTTMRAEKSKHYNIYAVGDAAAFDGPRQAHIAMLEAEVAAAHIVWRLTGQGEVPAFLPEFKCVMDTGGGTAIGLYSQWLSDGEIVKITQGSAPYQSKVKFEQLFKKRHGNPGTLHRTMMK